MTPSLIGRAVTGDVDVLFIGMECEGAPLSWLYGPLLTQGLPPEHDRCRRVRASDCERAMRIVKTLRCKEVYVYAMGMEPWLGHIMALAYKDDSLPIVESNRFLSECEDAGVKAERLYGKSEWVVR